MNTLPVPAAAASPLRQRLIADMTMRRFSAETQRNSLRDVGRLASFLRRSPDTASAEELRRFQIALQEAGLGAATMNAVVSALRFFFIHTIDTPDLARKLVRPRYPRSLPDVLSRDEVHRLLGAIVCLKHLVALSVSYGAGCVPRRSPASRSATSTRPACCCASNAARAGATATPCCPPTFSLSCASGGSRDTSRAWPSSASSLRMALSMLLDWPKLSMIPQPPCPLP